MEDETANLFKKKTLIYLLFETIKFTIFKLKSISFVRGVGLALGLDKILNIYIERRGKKDHLKHGLSGEYC